MHPSDTTVSGDVFAGPCFDASDPVSDEILSTGDLRDCESKPQSADKDHAHPF